MIPSWKHIQRKSFSRLEDLTAFLELSEEQKDFLSPHSNFPLLIPYRLAEKIKKRTLDDPILRQFVPTKKELENTPGYSVDPVGEQSSLSSPKLLHKYASRVLLIPSGNCVMNCRYCFRRHYPYAPQKQELENELNCIYKNPSIHEVILSGGDPLSLSDKELKNIIENINSIPHISKIRFHTRFPIGIPERITEELIEILKSSRSQIVFVIHTNHVQEWDETIIKYLKKIACLGIPILTQSVLLKGINDTPEALIALFKYLSDQGIIPYYLHLFDKTQNASHFDAGKEIGFKIIEECRKTLPGYAVPTFVQEIHGEPSKTPLHPVDRRKS